MSKPARRMQGLIYSFVPLPGNRYQVLGVASERGRQDELVLVADSCDVAGMRAWARDFRLVADTIDKLIGDK